MISKSRLIKLTQKLIRFNSENPPGNELAIARFIEKDMRSLGLVVSTPTFAKNRPNVIATLKGKSPNAKKNAILVTPHIDTVPAGTGWSVNPFGGIIKNGRIYGRGTSDDKGNLACAMEVMRSLVEDKIKFDHDVIFAATVDEETGSKQGIIPLLEKGILKPAAGLILDSDEFSTIIAQKGLMHARIQVFGKKAHGAYNWYGVNAIEIASQIIAEIKRYEFTPLENIKGADCLSVVANVCDGRGRLLKQTIRRGDFLTGFTYKKHHHLHGPTVNIGTIRGGDKVNMVADFCEFSFDLRFLPGMDPKNILATIKRLAGKYSKKFKLIVDDLQMPYEINQEHVLVKTYVNTCKKLKCPVVLKGSEGATVITFFQKKKIPAVATGYGTCKTAHTTDEYAKIDTLYKGAKVLEQFLKDYDKR